MNTLRWLAKLYIALLALVALGLPLVTLTQIRMPGLTQAAPALILCLFMTLAWLFPLPFSFKAKQYLDTSVIVATILVFDLGVAMLIVASGTALAHAIRRRPWDQSLFNSAQATLQAAAGSLILASAGWDVEHLFFNRPEQMLAIVAAGVAMYVVNHLSVAIIVSLQTRMAIPQVLHQSLRHTSPTEHLAHLAQIGMGVIGAILADTQTWALPLLLLPAGAVYSALDRHIQLQHQTEEALRDSEASLAEAQRVAHLGSWDWNLATGEQAWSDEAFRIFGFEPQAFVPTFETFLGCAHTNDRAALDQAVHQALHDGKQFSIDHRIRLPDGSERIVHQQGEVVCDQSGQKVRLVGTVHDITERKALEAQLAHQAFHDPLTGLPNRALFIDRLNQAFARAARGRPTFAVLFLDLDRFKLINDSFGHEAGDKLLIEVANRLSTCVRPMDTVARLGGDEFTVLLDELHDRRDAERIATRIADAFAVPVTIGTRELVITTSIGIVLPGQQHACAADLLRDADIALYQAKDGGRARYSIFDARMGTATQERMLLEADLRRAVERDELRLHYQPKVELATGRIVGVEALVRWQHPARGLVSPGDFIPLAEDTGLIVPIGWWVLEAACRQMRQWQEQFAMTDLWVMSVNLSRRQLAERDVVERITGILDEVGLDGSYLALEVTESAIMADQTLAADVLAQLRDLGIRIYVDDFGTGYSSLAALHRFPVDLVKIDRAFTANLPAGGEHVAIVRAILALADALHLRVIAEGIETADQQAQLIALGCDQGQGYHFARPVPGDVIGEMVALGSLHPSPNLELVAAD